MISPARTEACACVSHFFHLVCSEKNERVLIYRDNAKHVHIFRVTYNDTSSQAGTVSHSVLISMRQCKACAYFQGGTPLTEAANRQCVNFNETMQSMCIFSGDTESVSVPPLPRSVSRYSETEYAHALHCPIKLTRVHFLPLSACQSFETPPPPHPHTSFN